MEAKAKEDAERMTQRLERLGLEVFTASITRYLARIPRRAMKKSFVDGILRGTYILYILLEGLIYYLIALLGDCDHREA